MLETLIITLREGLEAALIVTIILTVLHRHARSELRGWVYGGLIVATSFALVGVFIVPKLLIRWRVNEEAYEGALYLIGAVLIGTLLFWLYRHRGWAGEVRATAERQLRRRWTGPALFAVTFLMVFREAVETLVFVTAISFSTTWMLQLIGFFIGVALAVAFGVALYRGSRWIPFRRVFRLSLIVLIVLFFQFALAGAHEWIEAGILPGGPTEMAIVGPIVNNQLLIFTVIVLVVAAFVFAPAPTPAPEVGVEVTDPHVRQRLQRAHLRTIRRWRAILLSTTLLAAFGLTGFYLYTKAPPMAPADPVQIVNRDVVIPLHAIPIRKIAFFRVTLPSGEDVRLLAVRVESTDVRVALDACVLCGPRGYYQRGEQVYCRHCAAPIVLDTIGQPGGCNPIPLPHTIREGMVYIPVRAIAEKIGDT